MERISSLYLATMLALLAVFLADHTGALRSRGRESAMRDESRARISRKDKQKQRRSEKPNIVFVITDDQDVELGSMNFMPKTLDILQDGGATFNNAFVTTPMCCPSRSSMLTGMYVHNHNTYTNNENCSSVQWMQNYEPRNFGVYLSNAGYRTGYFGKYLNDYTGTYIPPGWSEWVGLIRNTRFYNYSLNFNGKKIKHGDNYYKDYLTDLIANDSVTFLKQSKQYFPNRPVAMVLSMPAPHGPEDAAPQYQHLFPNISTHKTPSWNYAPNPDKQWILQYTGKMEPIHVAFTDMLQRKRLQTLQSVDDAVEKVYKELKHLGELDNTYFIFSSDHGYHLGQYGLLKGKAMPYEFDIKVPFYMRGPGIRAGIRVPNIVLNIDIAPTMLDIAGVPVPDHMDGRSIMRLFEGVDEQRDFVGRTMKRKKAWRDTFLVERGKISYKKLVERERIEAQNNYLMVTKEQRLEETCQKAEYQPPCSPNQQWECRYNDAGKLRLYKCRHGRNHQNDASPRRCRCPPAYGSKLPLGRKEKRRQRQFLKGVVNQPEWLKPRFIRNKRSVDMPTEAPEMEESLDVEKMVEGILDGDMDESVSKEVERTDDGTANPASQEEESEEGGLTEDRTANVEDLEYVEGVITDDGTSDPSSQEDFEDEVTVTDGGTADPSSQEVSDEDFIQVPEAESHGEPQRPGYDEKLFTPNAYETDIELVNPEGHQTMGPHTTFMHNGVSCRVLPNNTVLCNKDVYSSFDSWKEQKLQLDKLIQDYRDRLDRLKNVRKHLHQVRPTMEESYVEESYEVERDTEEEEVVPQFSSQPDPKGDNHYVDEDYDLYSMEELDLSGLPEGIEEEQVGLDTYGDCDCELQNEETQQLSERKKKKMERQSKREERKQERQREREKKRGSKKRRNKKKWEVTKDCNSPSMKCFTHDNDHWRTQPLWNSSGKVSSRRDPNCHIEGLECHRMDNAHWRTAPKWKLGPFCFCPNSNNNTYWCLRTINDTHNFLYCEFITGFISFYDIGTDPYQLRNAVHDLNFGVLQQLHTTLEKLKACRGSRECTIRTRPADEHLRRGRRNRWDEDNETVESEISKWRFNPEFDRRA